MYLTDLCFDDLAESNCELNLQKSLEIDSENNFDALQTFVSFRISQQNILEAAERIENIYLQTKPLREIINNRTIMDDLNNPDNHNNDIGELSNKYYKKKKLLKFYKDIPEDSFFISTVKLLIECASVRPGLVDCAVELLEHLFGHDDADLQLWFLMGVCLAQTTPPDKEAALFHFTRATELLNKQKQLMCPVSYITCGN